MAKEIKDVAASVRARLTAKAKEQGEDVQSVFTRYGVERFLYRLSISPHKEKFLLKGAALFSLWFNQPHRPTRDLDLLGFGESDIPALEKAVGHVLKIKAEDDGLEFKSETIRGERIREEEAYQGVRIQFIAMLGNARIPLQIDIGFGDAVTPGAEVADFPTLLDFPAPHLKVYPKETVVAEKFEAMVKLGRGNGRMKDFWDLNYMIAEFGFDGPLLQAALRSTFANRQTIFPNKIPVALTDDFARDERVVRLWSGFISRSGINRSTDLLDVVRNLRNFFEPIVNAEAKGETVKTEWLPGQGWK